MALVSTTLASAATASDIQITVASATGFAAGYYVRVDDEIMVVGSGYTSGTTIPVRRGAQGTIATAHVTAALVACGIGSDWDNPAAWQALTYPLAGRTVRVTTYSADGAITLPTAGETVVAYLTGTTQWDMTVAAPAIGDDGAILYIASDAAAAHTVTFTGGLSGAGSSYDVITVNSSAPVLLGPFMAVNQLWLMAVAVPLAGTVSNVTATVA